MKTKYIRCKRMAREKLKGDNPHTYREATAGLRLTKRPNVYKAGGRPKRVTIPKLIFTDD